MMAINDKDVLAADVVVAEQIRQGSWHLPPTPVSWNRSACLSYMLAM